MESYKGADVQQLVSGLNPWTDAIQHVALVEFVRLGAPPVVFPGISDTVFSGEVVLVSGNRVMANRIAADRLNEWSDFR